MKQAKMVRLHVFLPIATKQALALEALRRTLAEGRRVTLSFLLVEPWLKLKSERMVVSKVVPGDFRGGTK